LIQRNPKGVPAKHGVLEQRHNDRVQQHRAQFLIPNGLLFGEGVSVAERNHILGYACQFENPLG
jgi:hypothetical protein